MLHVGATAREDSMSIIGPQDEARHYDSIARAERLHDHAAKCEWPCPACGEPLPSAEFGEDERNCADRFHCGSGAPIEEIEDELVREERAKMMDEEEDR